MHRPRLIANFIGQFGWKPIILTVDSNYYEEVPDPDLIRTVNNDIEVMYTIAKPVRKPRLIGDIGLRSYRYLKKAALEVINRTKVDFIWIPIPSFYTSLLGPSLYRQTGVLYGIDYIDPWVRDITTRKDWRHRLSNTLAKYLEPRALKHVSLVTGVSHEYYLPALKRNFNGRRESIRHVAFPYGFDPNDHKIKLDGIIYPWSDRKDVKPWIYAGAFLPKSRLFIELLFKAIADLKKNQQWISQIQLYFIGTGAYSGKTIENIAEDAGLRDIVWEDRNRHSYLNVLNYLSEASTVMVIGSTEKHYTASKIYQAVLSESPVFAVLHEKSSASRVLEECEADQYLVRYSERMNEDDLINEFKKVLKARLTTELWSPDLKALDKYSARESARKLVKGMELVLSMSSRTE